MALGKKVSTSPFKVAGTILKNEGLGGFYNGFEFLWVNDLFL